MSNEDKKNDIDINIDLSRLNKINPYIIISIFLCFGLVMGYFLGQAMNGFGNDTIKCMSEDVWRYATMNFSDSDTNIAASILSQYVYENETFGSFRGMLYTQEQRSKIGAEWVIRAEIERCS